MTSAGAVKAGSAYVAIFADSSKLGRDLKLVEAKIAKFGSSVTSVGKSMATAGATLAGSVAAGLGGIGAVFAGFDDKMSAVQAISGATGESLNKLRDQAKDLGATTKFTAAEAAEAMKFLGMAGYDAGQIMASVGPVLNVAAAGMIDLGRAADLVSDATTAFGLSAEQTARVADVMAKTATSSNTSIEQMGEAFVYAAAQGKAAGQTIEDISAAIGILGNSGLKASIAGTGIQGMFKRMVSPKVGKFFVQLGVNIADASGRVKPLTMLIDELAAATRNMTQVERLKKFEQLFGLHAKTAVILVDNADALRKMTGELKNAEGSAASMAKTMSSSLMGAWLGFKSSIEGVVLALGEALKGPMRATIEIGTSMARALIKVVDANKQLITGIGAGAVVVGTLGAAVAVVGVGVIALGSAISAMSTIAGAAAGVVALVGAPFIAVGAAAAAGLVSIGGYFAYIAQQAGLLGPVFEFLRGSFGRVFGSIGKMLSGVTNAMKAGEWGLAAKVAWAGVKLATLEGAQEVLRGVDAMWNNAGMITMRFFKAFNSTVYKVFSSIPKIAMAALRGGASLDQVLRDTIGTALMGGNIDLASSLDPAIAAARQQAVALNRRAYGMANRPTQVAPQPQRQGVGGVGGVRPNFPMQQRPPINNVIPPQPAIAAAANAGAAAVARARPQGPAAGAAGGGDLVSIAFKQLTQLMRLVELGEAD